MKRRRCCGWTPPPRLAKEEHRVALGIVGREELRTYIQGENRRPAASWLHGPFRRGKCRQPLPSSKRLLCPQVEWRDFPYAVAEAMASRLPVVTSDIPSLSWAHRNPRRDVLSIRRQRANLPDALPEVLGWTHEQRARIVDVAQEFVRSRYGVRQWADQIMQQYRKLLGTSENARAHEGRKPCMKRSRMPKINAIRALVLATMNGGISFNENVSSSSRTRTLTARRQLVLLSPAAAVRGDFGHRD